MITTHYMQYILSSGYVADIGNHVCGSPAMNIWGPNEISDLRIQINSRYLSEMTINTNEEWYQALDIVKDMTLLGLMLEPMVIIRLWIIRDYLMECKII